MAKTKPTITDVAKADTSAEKKPQAADVKLSSDPGAEPLGAGPINRGMTEMPPLPDEETQKAGFYYPQANLLLQMYPDRFKRVTEKGA